jgi:hypothetical protein
MEKEIGKVTIIETDDGYQIDVKGKDLKEIFRIQCCPNDGKATDCSSSEEKKEE